MDIRSRIEADFLSAMRAKDETRVSTMRMIKAALLLKQKETDASRALHDEDTMAVLKGMLKKHQDSIESYRQAGRDDLAAQEESQRAIVASYLPAQMGETEVASAVERILGAQPAEVRANFGRAMGLVMSELKAVADGTVVQKAVKDFLARSAS